MSPAIDATVKLPGAPKGEGEIFKDVAEEENVGGKTVNVARWLAMRGASVACGGLLGEDNDRPFAKELAKYGIEDRFVRVPGATRRNEMIVWPGGSVKLNRAAFPGLGSVTAGTTGTIDALIDNVLSRLSCSSQMSRGSAVAILSGSLPPAIPKDFYARAVTAFKERGWTTVLDASGDASRSRSWARSHNAQRRGVRAARRLLAEGVGRVRARDGATAREGRACRHLRRRRWRMVRRRVRAGAEGGCRRHDGRRRHIACGILLAHFRGRWF